MRHAVSSFLTMNLVLTRDQAQVPWLRVAEVGTVATSFVNIADIVAGDEGVIAALRDNIEEGLFEAEVISCLEIVGNRVLPGLTRPYWALLCLILHLLTD